MKRSKAIIPLLLVALITMLTACSSGGNNTTGTEENTSAANTENVSNESTNKDGNMSVTKLALWHIQNEDNVRTIIEDSVARFEAANPGYKVDIQVFQSEAYKQKIRMALGANEAPDIFPGWTGGTMVEYINANQIIDLTDYMNKDNYKDYFMDAGIAQATYNGKIWAVPVENMSIAGIFYNSEIFERFGLSEPKTLSELEEICEVLKKNNIIPFALANKEKYVASFYYMYLVDRLAGPEVFANAANRTNGGTFEHESFAKAAEILQDWVKKGYFPDGFNSLDGQTGQHKILMYSEKAAMVVDGSWCVSSIKNENPEFLKKLKFMVFPAIEGGQGDPNNLVGTIGDTFYHISSKCPDPDAAFELIKYLIDETAVQKRIEAGRLPPVKSCTAGDPLSENILQCIMKAKNIQLWYDQYLPPEQAEVHKDALQALVGLNITPAEYNKRMEEAMKKLENQ